jgi:hypothetical protein
MATRPRIRFRKPRSAEPEPDGTTATALQTPPEAGVAHDEVAQPPPPPRPDAPQPASSPPATTQPAQPPSAGSPRPETPPAAATADATPSSDGQAGAARPASAATSSTDPSESTAGLRAWLAQLDRKLGIRTYIGLALAVLALAAGGAALYLTLTLKQDAATKSDVNALRDQVSGVAQSATQAAQDSVNSLDQRLTQLESEVGKLSTTQKTSKRELRAVQSDIRQLRSQATGGGQTSSGLPSTGGGVGNSLGSGSGNGGVGP